MYGANIQCKSCGENFAGKENQIRCPHCQKLLPLEDILVTELGIGLKYIAANSGKETLSRRDKVVSILSDVLHDARKDVRFIRVMYQVAEPEIAAFVRSAARKKEMGKSTKNLIDALGVAFIDSIWMDRGVSALMEACDMDPNQFLGGKDHPLLKTDHHFNKDEFSSALKEIQDSQGKNAWKNTDTAAALVLDINSKLKDEARLLKRAGQAADKILYGLMEAVNSASYSMEDEKKPAAQLQMALLDVFMDAQAIDFLVESILNMKGIPYTQQLYHAPSSVSSTKSNQFTRPRKQGGTRQGTTGNTAGGQGTSVSHGTGQSHGTSGTGTGGSVTQKKTGQGTGIQATPVKKKTSVLLKLAILAVIAVIGVKVAAPMAGKISSGKEKEVETSVEETFEAETSEPEQKDPYPSPSVGTSARQVGIYQLGNIVEQNSYGEYQGPEKTFAFKYPRVLYDHVDYSFENEGKDIDILFYSEGDPNSLTVSLHPMPDGKTPEELKAEILAEAEGTMTDFELASQRQIMAGTLADTKAETGCAFYLKGRDSDDSRLYWIYRITADTVETMRMTVSKATDEADRAYKEFYAEVMYSQCAFGGNTARPVWSQFKKDYDL